MDELSGAGTEAIYDLAPLGLACGGYGTPLQETWVDLTSASQVLYGLNGAGKTTILDALNGVLAGHQSGGRLLVRLPYERDEAVPALTEPVAEMLTGDYLDLMFGADNVVAGLSAALRADFAHRTRVRDLLGGDGWQFSALEWDGLLDAMAATPWWLFAPTGSATNGARWSANPVIPTDPAGGPWAAHLSALHELAEDDDAPLMSEVGLEPLWWNAVPEGAPGGIVGTFLKRETTRSAANPWWPFGKPITDDAEDPTVATRQHLMENRSYLRGFEPDGSFRREVLSNNDALARRALAIQQRANWFLSLLLADAPSLTLDVGDEAAWFSGSSCRWSATRFDGDDPLTLSALSSAERRWVKVSIELALAGQASAPQDPVHHMVWTKEPDLASPNQDQDQRGGTTWLLLDEPERGLHRTAESQMAEGIQHLTSSGIRSVLATHSPELLDQSASDVNYVRRRSKGRTGAVVPMSGFDDIRAELGLNPSDLLRRTRGIALVEGEHDLEVLSAAIGPELNQLGVTLLATRGAMKLKTVVDSRFLYEFTDAVLFPLLDDLSMGPVGELWERQTVAARTQPAGQVIAQLKEELRGIPGKGRDFLEEFLAASLKNGTFERVHPLGIAATDILLCLPVKSFVQDAETWEQLRDEAKRNRGGEEPSETAFKDFLRKNKGADLSAENIRRVAAASPVHVDIKALLAAMSERLSR